MIMISHEMHYFLNTNIIWFCIGGQDYRNPQQRDARNRQQERDGSKRGGYSGYGNRDNYGGGRGGRGGQGGRGGYGGNRDGRMGYAGRGGYDGNREGRGKSGGYGGYNKDYGWYSHLHISFTFLVMTV